MAQEIDLVFKVLAARYAADFVLFVRGKPVSEVRRVEKEAVATRRETDLLFRVRENGEEYLMLMEVQTRPDPEMARRLLEYTALHHRAYGLPVYPVVLNLTGCPAQGAYGFECLGERVVSFWYRQINLREVQGAGILREGPVGLIPLVPLMRHEEAEEEVLRASAERVREAPPEARPDLYLGLGIFAALRVAREVILKVIEVSQMEQSPLFDGIREKWIDQGLQRGLQQGLQQGLQEGLQRGRRSGLVEAVLEALAETVGEYPRDLPGRLERVEDPAVLKALLRKAARARSLEEFTAFLTEVLGSHN